MDRYRIPAFFILGFSALVLLSCITGCQRSAPVESIPSTKTPRSVILEDESGSGVDQTSTPVVESSSTPTTAAGADTPAEEPDREAGFEGVPAPPGSVFDSTSETEGRACYHYLASAPPHTVVQDYASLLAAPRYGWQVDEVYKTGTQFDDSASTSAVHPDRTGVLLVVNAVGVEEGVTEVAVCVPTESGAHTPDESGSDPVVPSFRLTVRDCETYRPSPQDVEGETYFCGVLIVPQDRSSSRPAAEGMEIEIRYAVVKSHSTSPQPDPVLFLSGGPGNSALHPDVFPELVARFDALRQQRDLVFFDQRGVGFSSPPFDWWPHPTPPEGEVKAELDRRYEAETGLTIAEISASDRVEYVYVLDLWNKGIELTHYNSAANAADAMDLMAALSAEYGYPAFNLYGISYGSRLALTLLREYPHTGLVRTSVLDSVFPVEQGEYRAQYYIERNQMFESVFELCAADAACARAYPDLRARFAAVVEKMNRQPLKLPDDTGLTGDKLHQSMFPYGADWTLRIPHFPKMITELESGQTETFMGLRRGTLLSRGSDEVPDAVYQLMNQSEGCTRVGDYDARQPYYRRMYNASPEAVLAQFEALCTASELAALQTTLDGMDMATVNEFVGQMYNPQHNAAALQLRKSMNCYEEVPFGDDLSAAESRLRDAGLPEFLILEALYTLEHTQLCQYWPTGTAPGIENQPVTGRADMLILNGQLDSITYPWWAEDTQQHISGSRYALVPGAAHSLVGNHGACLDQIVVDFINNPAAAPDFSCLSGLAIQFELP